MVFELIRSLEVPAVASVATTLAGNFIYSRIQGDCIEIVDWQTKHVIQAIQIPFNKVSKAMLSRDGQTIASYCWDDHCYGVSQKWDVQTGQELAVSGFVAISADRTIMASHAGQETIKIIDFQTGEDMHIVQLPNRFSSIAISPDGRLVAASNSNDNGGIVKVWHVSTGQELYTFVGSTEKAVHTDDYDRTYGVEDIVISPDGRQLIAELDERKFKVWSLETGDLNQETKAYSKSSKREFAVTPDSKTLLFALGHSIVAWNLTTRREIRSFRGHKREVTSIAVSPDGQTFLSNSREDGIVKQWNLQTGEELYGSEGHSDFVFAVAVSPDSQTIASGSRDGTVKLWDALTGQQLHSFDLQGRTDIGFERFLQVLGVVFSPDGQTVIAGIINGFVICWDVQTKQEISLFQGYNASSIVISPDGQLIIGGAMDEKGRLQTTVRIGNLHQIDSATQLMAGHSDFVWTTAISPDGQTLVSGSDDCTIKLWDIQTRQHLRTFTGHESQVRSVAISPDGQLLVSSSADGTIKVWDLITGQELRTIAAHSRANFFSLAISPTGELLASSGDSDFMIKVWRLSTGEEICQLSGHTEGIRLVAFSPNGQFIVSGSHDNTVKIWGLR